MGEMADYLIEQETDYLDDDYGDYEEEGDGPPSFDPQWTASKILKCRFCNKSPLQWKRFNGKWIMFEMDNDIHDCLNNPLPIDTLKEIYQKKDEF